MLTGSQQQVGSLDCSAQRDLSLQCAMDVLVGQMLSSVQPGVVALSNTTLFNQVFDRCA